MWLSIRIVNETDPLPIRRAYRLAEVIIGSRIFATARNHQPAAVEVLTTILPPHSTTAVMAKGARASTTKANNARLKSRVFGPVETERTARLSAKLLALASQPKPTPKTKEDVAMDGEEGITSGFYVEYETLT